MALYGNNFYGLFKYGPDTLVDFDSRPFTADAPDYSSLQLNWTNPSGDWDLLHVVRNPLGFPVTADDGKLIVELTSAGNPSFLDKGDSTEPLVQGKTYYYSIFVRRTGDGKWFNAAVTYGTVVKDYGTAAMMYDYLPFMYKAAVDTLSGNVSEYDLSGNLIDKKNEDLVGFLKLFAFEYDKFKTDAENVKQRYDVANLHGALIPAMMNQFGFNYEQEMGLQQGRRLVQNAINIYRKHGSISGLKTFINAFSGYNTYIGTVRNLMLTVDSSSFERSTDGWNTTTNVTLSAISGASESPAVAPYLESTSPANYPNSTLGLMKAVITAAATASFACGAATPVTTGIPVVASTAYTFTIYSRAKTTARAISLNIDWYDRFGAYIGSGTAATSTNSTSAWTRATKVTATSPATAYFAVPKVSIASGGAGEIHYFDAAQFELGSTANNYVDARRIDLYMGANRINEIINPSFETNTDNWVIFNGTKSRVTAGSLSSGAVTGSSAWMDVKASSTNVTIRPNSANSVTVRPNTPYTFSAYLKTDTLTGDTAYLRVIWLDEDNNAVSSSIQPSFTNLNDSWKRLEYSMVSPETAVLGVLNIDVASDSGSSTISVDAALFESASYAQAYFDGSTGYYQTDDLLWENGDDVNGRSLYYKNRVVVTKRLSAVIGDYVPYGAQWALFVGLTVS
jgi:hypothetical protein